MCTSHLVSLHASIKTVGNSHVIDWQSNVQTAVSYVSSTHQMLLDRLDMNDKFSDCRTKEFLVLE